MKLLKLLRSLLYFDVYADTIVQVRIVKRDNEGVIISEKYVDIESVYNPVKGPIGININQKDIDKAIRRNI